MTPCVAGAEGRSSNPTGDPLAISLTSVFSTRVGENLGVYVYATPNATLWTVDLAQPKVIFE